MSKKIRVRKIRPTRRESLLGWPRLGLLFFRSVVALALLGVLSSCKGNNTKPAGRETAAPGEAQQSSAPNAPPGPADDSRKLIESRESLYNNIYVYQTGSNLSMTFGLNQKIYTESVYNTRDDLDLPVPYTQFMTASLMYPKKLSSILEIGSGGGRTSWYLHRLLPDAQVTTVELDPVVAELAHKYFGIREEQNFHVVTEDGRLFLAGSKAKYDLILIDAYRGPFVPFHLLTTEFYRLVRSHLTEGGVMAQNVEVGTMLFDSAVNTLHAVFPQIDFYVTKGFPDFGNTVMVAYDGQGRAKSDLKQIADRLQSTHGFRYDLREMLEHRYWLKTVMAGQTATFDIADEAGQSMAGIDENAKVLTDDFAPVESLKAIAKHNKKWTTTPQ